MKNTKSVKARGSLVENLVYIEGRTDKIVALLVKMLQTVWSDIICNDYRFDTVRFDNWMYGPCEVRIESVTEEYVKTDIFWYKEDGSIRTHMEATVDPNGVVFDRHIGNKTFKMTSEIAVLETLIESVQVNNPTVEECERHPELDGRGNADSVAAPGDFSKIKLLLRRKKSKKKYNEKVGNMRPYDRWTWCKPGYWRRTGYCANGTQYEYDAKRALKELAARS